jgi:hypothetical protein
MLDPTPTPVPLKGITCGVPVALSATLTFAVRVPVAEGVKVTVKVHVAPAVRVPGQLSVSPKSEAFVPVIVLLEIVSDAVPVLVIALICVGLATLTVTPPKLRLIGANVTAGAAEDRWQMAKRM